MKQTCNNCYNNIRAHGAFGGMDYCMEVQSDDNTSGGTTEQCYQNNGIGCKCWHEQTKISVNGGKYHYRRY